MLRTRLIFAALILSIQQLSAFTPGILTYSTKDYNAHQVNYDAFFDDSGLLYVANAYGLLTFDGDSWKKTDMSVSNSPISLCQSSDGRLYFGANNDLGYAEKNAKGVLQYYSLTNLLPDSLRKNIGWVHHCAEFKGKIYFAAEYAMYVFNGKKLEVKYPNKGNKFLYLENIGGTLCIMELGKGIGFVTETGTDWLQGDLQQLEIRGIEKLKGNAYYLYGREAVYQYQNGQVSRVSSLDFVAKSIISDVVFTSGKRIISTEQSGVFVLDNNFKTEHHFSATDGTLPSNYVYAIANNNQGDVCLATNNGIAIIPLSSPVLIVDESAGIAGAGYSSFKFDEVSYLGTSQGLYYSLRNNEKYTQIANVKAFVRAMHSSQGSLFCADQQDVYQIKNGVASVISKNSWRGAWQFKAVPNRSDIFLVGTYSGIDVYRWIENQWKYSNTIKGFSDQAKTFEFDDNGNLWVANGATGLFRLMLNEDFTKVTLKEDFCKKLNLKSDYFIELVKDENMIYVASVGGLYRVEGNYLMKEKWVEGLTLNRIRKIKDGLLYTIENRQPVILKRAGRTYVIDSLHLLNNISVELIGNSEMIDLVGNNLFLIGTPDGFLLANAAAPKKHYGKVSLRQISDIESDSLIELNSVEIPYSSNNLRFSFSFSPFENFYDVQWYVMLQEDGEGEWKKIEKAHLKEFTNLYEGEYVFKVKALSRYTLLGETSYAFTILPPWYRTTLAKIFYFLLFIACIYVAYKLYQKRLLNLQLKMEEEKRKELLIQENAHKAELLQKELQEKETELSFIALNYSQKKELFEHIGDKLDTLLEKADDPRALRAEIRGLEYSMNNSDGDEEKKWLEFQVHFNKEHNDYLEKIKAVDPNMKESMLLMCTYIRMGKSNKDICNLLNISINALDKRKSRLREKFNVPEDITLNEYLRQL